ncbi:MAG: hypothetical protein JSV61_12510 [Anaerolineales bacterium]|nr:MAG: hypothetical protein JSV61_12510 [Anaerolineales bacterium]
MDLILAKQPLCLTGFIILNLMPILEIEIVLKPGENLAAGLAQKIANQAAAVFSSPPGDTWVRLRTLAATQYAENGGWQAGIFPIFVTILKAKLPEPQVLHQELDQLTRLIAEVCNRPQENVHILYLPPAAGRMAFGGRLVSSRDNSQGEA